VPSARAGDALRGASEPETFQRLLAIGKTGSRDRLNDLRPRSRPSRSRGSRCAVILSAGQKKSRGRLHTMRTRQGRTNGMAWCLWGWRGSKYGLTAASGLAMQGRSSRLAAAPAPRRDHLHRTHAGRYTSTRVHERDHRTGRALDLQFRAVSWMCSIIARRRRGGNTDDQDANPGDTLTYSFATNPGGVFSLGGDECGWRRSPGAARRRITRCGSGPRGAKRSGVDGEDFRAGASGASSRTAIRCHRRALA